MFYVAYVRQEGRQWLAEFPDAPGCQTFADSEEELLPTAQEALEGWLEAHLVDGEAPPRPKQRHKMLDGAYKVEVPVSASLSAVLCIRWVRQDRDLSQAELAKMVGVSQQQSAKLEDPDGNPTLRTRDQVGRALGLQLHVSFSN
jgi:predicted RNase H-like HicB family nuclease/DNA-binding XRE family transcriptional regulator